MKELLNLINTTATINLSGLDVEVTIKNVKNTYGRNRYQVTPVSGSGEIWIEKIKK